jgi:hypothetical protein
MFRDDMVVFEHVAMLLTEDLLLEIKISKRHMLGCAIAQAASRWLPTAAARFKTGSSHVGFVVDKVALGQDFSEYFGFRCQSSFHQFLHNHHQHHPGLVQ